jgi:hypothetical protein
VMPEQTPTCPYGPESDIDARYLAGSLSAEESEAFEEHYFGCDRCFAAVQRGTEIRAALSAPPIEATAGAQPGVIPIARTRRRFSSWQPVLAAAGLIIAAVGVRQVAARRTVTEGSSPPPTIEVPRGAGNAFNLTSHATSTVLAAAWSRPSTARSYRVRLLAVDGSLLFEREIADTSIMLSRDLVRGNDRVYWEVQALDALRSIVATSPVVQAQTSPGPP